MNYLKENWIAILSIVVIVSAAGLYGLLASPIYEVSGSVLVHRSKVENPHSSNEESRNRWIWVRDGMGIEESLLSHDFLLSLLASNQTLRKRYLAFYKKNSKTVEKSRKLGAKVRDVQIAFVNQLIKNIKIDFKGGDSYTYIFKVRDPDPLFAKAVVEALIDSTRNKTITETKKAYDGSIKALSKQLKTETAPDSIKYLKDTKKQILASSVLFDASVNQRVETILQPYVPINPVWPNRRLLLIVALFFGISFGLTVQFVLARVRRQ